MNKNLPSEINLIIECSKIEKNEEIIISYIEEISSWNEFISLSYSHGVFPLVYNTLKNYFDKIPMDILQSMKLRNLNIVKQNMMMTSELLKVLKILEENNILAIPFKGPVLSQLAYGDVVSRQYVDLDILVDKKDLEKSKSLLKEYKYEEYYDLVEYQKENLKDVVHDISLINQQNGVNIELHWTLSSGEFFIDLEKLRYTDDSNKFKISNQNINVFSNEKLFVYLCVHGYKHLWERIEWLVDLYYLIKKDEIDLSNVISYSRIVDADRIVLSSLIICQKIFDVNFNLDIKILSDKKLNLVSNRMLNSMLKNYVKINEKINTKSFSTTQLYMLKTNKNKIKYLKTLLMPTEIDYEKVKISEKFHFLYYLLRPFNILKRVLFKN